MEYAFTCELNSTAFANIVTYIVKRTSFFFSLGFNLLEIVNIYHTLSRLTQAFVFGTRSYIAEIVLAQRKILFNKSINLI